MTQTVAPVSQVAIAKQPGPNEGIGLALSGGGYRAMLFHLGAFIRLFELGLLKDIDRISSVSGASITSAKVALEWKRLKTRDDFFDHVVVPIRRLARWPIDIPCVAAGLLTPWTVSECIAGALRAFLFGNASIRQIPTRPQFIFDATNVETGTLWRITRDYMADWKVGRIESAYVRLAEAVAASAAFPPFLSPYVLGVRPADFKTVYRECKDRRLLSDIALTDGGVYDNLGLETIWKSYRNVLVSDASAALQSDPRPARNWLSHSGRVIGIGYGQAASLRKRQLIASYKAPDGDTNKRRGAYWGIGSDIKNYHFGDALEAQHERTEKLAKLGTQLRPFRFFSKELDERLINWGYAICDTAVRKHFGQRNDPPAKFPYPGGV